MKINHSKWQNPYFLIVTYYPVIKTINYHNVFKEDLTNPVFNNEYVIGRWNIKYKNK